MKSGLVALIGRSNVGKSTLLNNLIGSKVAITSPKAQTTRHSIQGVLNDARGQMVFVDTPGILQKRDRLTKRLLHIAKSTLDNVDVIVYVVDPTRSIGSEEKFVLNLARSSPTKKILCINKIDDPRPDFIESYRALAEEIGTVVEVSALRGTNLKLLINILFELLPEGEPLYPEGQLTNLTNEELIAELIREKLFLRLHDEVPYGLHVVVDDVKERENGDLYIHALILTNDERHKRYIIGSGGRGIKEIGQSARKDLESIMQKHVYLELEVEFDEHWVERLAA
ncbi:GTPase Era [Candidatus Uhrbacteria bacterium]|nr:GTPase Era [Candidatus Uhrbacteria bacterium]